MEGLDVEFMLLGEEHRLPPEVELSMYRIAQEALNNVVHHAQAKRAVVYLQFNEDIQLEVRDDGIGFVVPKSPTEFAPRGHFGFLGMRERADLIGARLDVQSESGKGTRLSVTLPASPDQPKRKKKRD